MASWLDERLCAWLEVILSYLGHDVDYDTIMGDIGQAFIMQGEENSINLIDGAVDVGWWPLEPLGIIRLNFLEKTVGCQIRDAKLPMSEIGGDPIKSYRQWLEPTIRSSLRDNKPCLARVGSAWYIVTGYDDEESPLIGMCSNAKEGDEGIYRIEEEPALPYASLAIGEAIPTLDRTKADFEALNFAIALHRDEVLGAKGEYHGEYPLRRADEFGTYWRTGLKSFSSWIACLEKREHWGHPYGHANVQGFLERNRKTAVRYLRTMQKRHSEAVGTLLENASEKYETIIGELEKGDTSGEALSSVQGRERLISSIKRISTLESQAVAELERAVKAFG